MRLTRPRGALPGQPQESFLLEDEAAPDEDAGADGQPQAEVEVVLAPVLTHSEAVRVVAVTRVHRRAARTGRLREGFRDVISWCVCGEYPAPVTHRRCEGEEHHRLNVREETRTAKRQPTRGAANSTNARTQEFMTRLGRSQ